MSKVKSQRLLDLIEDNPVLCKSLAINKDSFRAVLFQIQLDITTEENLDTISPTILALKNIHTVFESIVIAGEALIATEQKK